MQKTNKFISFLLIPLLILATAFLFIFKNRTLPALTGLTFSSGIQIIRGPYQQLTDVTKPAIAILWETNFPCEGNLYYWNQINEIHKIKGQKNTVRHTVQIENLDEDKQYYYRVTAGNRFSKLYSLKVFPRNKKEYKFIAYGDSRHNHRMHQSLIEEMLKFESDFIIHTGDFVDRGGNLDDWDIFFFITRPIISRVPLFPVIGNHDYNNSSSSIFKTFFLPPSDSPNYGLDYFFDTGNSRFVVMENRFISKKGNIQKEWFKNLLKEANSKGLTHKFVFFHQGIASSGPHGVDKKLVENGYVEIMKENNVTLVIAGHDHMYERGIREGVRYLITGGGGAPIYSKIRHPEWTQQRVSDFHFIWFSVSGDMISFKVIGMKGKIIEECKLTSKDWKCFSPAGLSQKG